MPTGYQYRTSRYSRAPSLTTIGSNEEADFSTSRKQRQSCQSAFSISPLSEHGPSYLNPLPSAVPYGSSNHQTTDRRCSSIYSPVSERHLSYSDQLYQSHFSGVGGGENYHSNIEPAKPELARSRPLSFVLPEMDSRPTTAASESGASNIKYMKTRYMWMLLQLDQIPWWHNILATTAAWIVLAAYLIVPGTFSSFEKTSNGSASASNTPKDQLDHIAGQVVNSVNNLGLLVFSGILAGTGGLVCVFLFFMHWQNYAWLTIKIFQPMTLNAFAGLLTTIVNVYTAQERVWSPTAKINAIVTGTVAGVAGSLLVMYNFWLLNEVKQEHRKLFPQDAELVDPIKQNRFHQKVGRFLPSQKGY